jgi:nitrogen regulatory protein P-II 1
MEFKYVVAIVRPEVVRRLEERLVRLDISGISLSRVKGFGEYKNFFSNDWLTEHVRIEIIARAGQLDALLDALLEVTGPQSSSSGIVAVMPVERFLHLRDSAQAAEALHPAVAKSVTLGAGRR